MDDRWKYFFEQFPETVTSEQLPVKLPRFDLDLSDLAGAAADWCQQYLKDRKCPSDLTVFLIQKVINNLRVQWAAEPKLFGYRPEKEDYQALWLMQRVIGELNEVCLNHATVISYHQPILTSIWYSSFVLKNARRQMEDYVAVVPYLHSLFDIKDYGEASFYAVYDGHNGLDAAVYSSMYLHQFLIQSAHYPTNPENALYEAFFATDNGFTQKTEKYNLVSGSTAVCALHRPQEKKLYVGWVGDSVATLWKNGTPVCLVNKHVPERHDETQRIENEGGMISKCQGIWRVDGQLAVSRAIGDVKYKPHITCQPEIRSLVLDGNEEFLVLCSDGLWEYMTPEDISETIYNELLETDGDVSEVCSKLVYKSKAKGSKDNISVVTVFLQDPKQLVVTRRAVIMETAMEQRNANATLASYGQDTGDFGPETDVDTPEEPIGLTKPLVEGEANVIDESGEDSEEDGGGWNYYNKTTEETEKKTTYQENDNTGNNSDAEDMDYKLNPDAPEFVPVSSPIPPINHAQRFLEMDNDDFISSSPQKYKESIDGEDVPDENDFTNEIKVHAADLSKFNNPFEPNDSTMLNGIKPLSEEVSGNNESTDNSITQNEHVTNGNLEKYQNPFASEVDLNKVQDLSEYLNDSAQTYKTDPYVSIIETNKNNEINSTNCDNVLQHESNVKLNDDLSSLNEHMKYEQNMNSTNTDDTFNTTNAMTGSTFQQDDESFKYGDGFKSDFMESNHVDKFGLCDDHKLNDSVSTTDAVLGSEPHTPMRMDNQSTFESENDDDQFSESFKQQLQFNQFDDNNDKENHDPFCFEQTAEDPAGIIPNVTHEVTEEVNETHHGDIVQSNESSNEHQVFELTTHEPVVEPLCVKEQAKPIHSDLYEQQYLPESDFSASTREALMNATESEFNHQVIGVNNEQLLEDSKIETRVVNNKQGHPNVDKHLEQEQYNLKHEVPSHTDVEDVDSDVDNVKVYLNDNTCDNEQENNSVNLINNHGENSEVAHNGEHSNEDKSVEYYKQEIHASDMIKERIEDPDDRFNFEKMMHGGDGKKEYNAEENCVEDSKQDNYSFAEYEKHTEEIKQEYCENVVEDTLSNIHDLHYQDQLSVSNINNQVENIVDVAQSHIEDVEETHNALPEFMQNHVEVFKQEHHDVTEVKHSHLEDFKQDYCDTVKPENNHEHFIPEHHNITEVTHNDNVESYKQKEQNSIEVENGNVDDFKQGHCIDPIEIHAAESDEEMHSSMIIHSDVENNTPQPYCSSHDTLLNETDMMCTSMTFEENFQNRNMSDSLYVMETSSDYFGDDVQSATQLDKPINEPKADEQSLPIDSKLVESTNIETEIVTEAKSESSQLYSQDLVEKIDEQEDSNKVVEIAVAAAVGTAAIAAVTGTSLASKKSTPKKTEATVSKATKTKTTPTKPLALKTSAPIKKTTSSTTTSKPLSRPTTAPSTTAKPTSNVRPTTVPKVTAVKATTITKTAPKTTVPTSRPTSAKTTPTTPRVSLAKTTATSSPRTSTAPKTSVATKSATTPKTSTTPRSSTLVSKQLLTNGSPKPLSRPISAPAKKSLSSATTNSTTKLTNGVSSKTSTSTKPPVTLATRMSLAPPKLPPKVKVAPKTVTPPAMPGPIRRPNAPITKKTETATS